MSKMTTDFITLQQYLKFCGLASTGGEAKFLIKETEILVNGEVEKRRGRKLYEGDEVVVEGRKYIVGE